MVDLTKVQNLIGLLRVLCGTNAREIKRVRSVLKSFLESENCILPLMQVLLGESEDTVRQEAGALLKKYMIYFITEFPPEQQISLKKQLVERLLAEKVSSITITIILIIKSVCTSCEWPELVLIIDQLVYNSCETRRKLGFTLLSEVRTLLIESLLLFILFSRIVIRY